MSANDALPDTAAAYALSVLRPSFAKFRSLEARARLGEDADAVHDMRVETRRLRAALSTFEQILPETFAKLRAELKWVGAELGAVRDLDVQIESLRAAWDKLTDERLQGMQALVDRLTQIRVDAQAALVACLTSERYADLTAQMTMALAPSTSPPPEQDEPVSDYAPRLIKRRHRKLKKAAAELTPSSPAAQFHEARIRTKRLRYTVEAFAPLYGKRAEELIEEATALQDVLGGHQDLIVLNQRLENLVREGTLSPWALVVTGEVVQRNRARAKSIRKGWQGLGALRDCWRRLKREL